MQFAYRWIDLGCPQLQYLSVKRPFDDVEGRNLLCSPFLGLLLTTGMTDSDLSREGRQKCAQTGGLNSELLSFSPALWFHRSITHPWQRRPGSPCQVSGRASFQPQVTVNLHHNFLAFPSTGSQEWPGPSMLFFASGQ